MIGRMTDWFDANPNAYLAIMAAYAAVAVIASTIGRHELAGLILTGVFALICAAAIYAPFESGDAARQMAQWERRYRFARVALYPVVALVLAAVALGIPALDASPWTGVELMGAFSALNIGQHIRYRRRKLDLGYE
jgi:hypothetical protein